MKQTSISKKHAGIIAIILSLLMTFMSACGNTAPENSSLEKSQNSDVRVLNDSYGKVTIEGEMQRVISTAPAYTVSILLMGGADKLVGIDANTASNDFVLKMYPQIADLPVVTADGELNEETILSLNPDLVILTPAMKEGHLESLQNMGITVINEPEYDNNRTLLERNRDRQVYYGTAIGGLSLDIADAYEKYFNNMVDNITSKTSNIAEADRPVILEIRNIEPLTVCNGNDRSVAQDWIKAAGGINAAGENTSDGTSGSWEVSVEQILTWNPEYIICSNSANADDLLTDERFSEITAVKKGNVVNMPKGLMVWGYNGPELPLFVEFAGKYIHPELFRDINIIDDTKEFYSKFFNINITDEDFRSIFITDLSPDEYIKEVFNE